MQRIGNCHAFPANMTCGPIGDARAYGATLRLQFQHTGCWGTALLRGRRFEHSLPVTPKAGCGERPVIAGPGKGTVNVVSHLNNEALQAWRVLVP
jgi:hypothetical protein